VTVDGGRLRTDRYVERPTYVRPRVDAGYVIRAGGGREFALDGSAAAALGGVPPQADWRIGGRGTVPGYDFRTFGGDAYTFGRLTYGQEIARPFLRGRLFAAAGWTGDAFSHDLSINVLDGPSPAFHVAEGARRGGMASVGAGVGLFYDILRVDLARGLGSGGRWEVIVEANPSFWDFL
jgi:hypothetical protein